MGEHGGVEALPQHGRGLQRGLVTRFEPVDPGLHQAPNRARDGGVRPLLGVAQELLEEERVASGARWPSRSLPPTPLWPSAA